MKKQKGFTLIEVLVVIGIIAILAAVVLIAINPSRQFRQARDTQRVTNLNAMLSAVGQYVADNKGAIPGNITSNVQNIKTGGADICSQLVPTYISALPVDPNFNSGVSVADCSASYDTGYQIGTTTGNRIVVSAMLEGTTTPYLYTITR